MNYSKIKEKLEQTIQILKKKIQKIKIKLENLVRLPVILANKNALKYGRYLSMFLQLMVFVYQTNIYQIFAIHSLVGFSDFNFHFLYLVSASSLLISQQQFASVSNPEALGGLQRPNFLTVKDHQTVTRRSNSTGESNNTMSGGESQPVTPTASLLTARSISLTF